MRVKKQALTKIMAAALLLMFVNFMFSNVIFMHVHKDVNGHPITHSHPYLPSGNHTHTGNTINLLSGFNIAASATLGTTAAMVATPEIAVTNLYCKVRECSSSSPIHTSGLRGPPSMK